MFEKSVLEMSSSHLKLFLNRFNFPTLMRCILIILILIIYTKNITTTNFDSRAFLAHSTDWLKQTTTFVKFKLFKTNAFTIIHLRTWKCARIFLYGHQPVKDNLVYNNQEAFPRSIQYVAQYPDGTSIRTLETKTQFLRRPFQFSVNEVFRMKGEHFSFKMKVLAIWKLAKQSQKTPFCSAE